METHPALTRRERARRLRADTKEDIPGIFCRRGAEGRPFLWTAHRQRGPGKKLQKSFSVGRYGDSARDMAIREREWQLTQMRGVVFGLLDVKGRRLLEQHAAEPEIAAVEPVPWPMPSMGCRNQSNTSGFSGGACSRAATGSLAHGRPNPGRADHAIQAAPDRQAWRCESQGVGDHGKTTAVEESGEGLHQP